MIDLLTTALVVFAILAGSALGWAAIVGIARGTRAVSGELIRDRTFIIGGIATVALLAFLIAT